MIRISPSAQGTQWVNIWALCLSVTTIHSKNPKEDSSARLIEAYACLPFTCNSQASILRHHPRGYLKSLFGRTGPKTKPLHVIHAIRSVATRPESVDLAHVDDCRLGRHRFGSTQCTCQWGVGLTRLGQ
jgi:hypothetical protein